MGTAQSGLVHGTATWKWSITPLPIMPGTLRSANATGPFQQAIQKKFLNLRLNLLLANNIFAFNTGPEISEPTGIYLGPGVNITEHHNLYFSRVDGEITAEFLGKEFTRQELADGTWASETGQGEGIQVVDPAFVSGWPDVDLSLLPSSPAVNAGDNQVCPDVDALGHPRVHNAEDACDLGALEWSE